MSKRVHPIRKMLRALDLYHSSTAPASDRDIYQRAVARHVKPLLDALAEMPGIAMGCTGPGNTLDQAKGYSDACREIAAKIRERTIPLLAAWKEPL